MYKAQRLTPLGFISSYIYQLLVLIGCFVLLFGTNSSFAAVQCDAGFVSDIFSDTDYNNLGSTASPPVLGVNQLLNNNINESYTLASNALSAPILDPNGTNFYRPQMLAGNIQSFEFFQDFPTKTATRTVSYTFNNRFNNQPQALSNLSLSIYDIDANFLQTGTGGGGSIAGARYFEFSDEVTISGVTSSGSTITPTLNFRGNGITATAPYRQSTTTGDVICARDSVDTNCKITVSFSQPVVKVDVTYGNNPNVEYYGNNSYSNPGDQLINIVFEGYCYLPQPRLVYTKEISNLRRPNSDQFTVQIKDNEDNTVVTNALTTTTTTGSGSTVTAGTGTTGTYKINPTKSYTLTEAGSGATDLANYSDLYECRKADGTIVAPLNPKNLKLTYGDNWTCKITNSRNYIFSGTVFDDNGGISSNQADATNANMDSGAYANTDYFNGVFNTVSESGIAGSTVKLVNCTTPSTVYGTQQVASSGATIGQYRFAVPIAMFNGSTDICITEERSSVVNTYPIRTTNDSLNTGFAATKYNYLSNNFGRVIPANAALVLRKAQYVNDCSSTLNYSATNLNTPRNTDPKAGFSESPINGTNGNALTPGQCIAYRITATNRSNLAINDFVMQDILQKKGVNGAPVTSVIANPALSIEYATESPIVGANGTVKTTPLVLAPRTNRNFYFNTKYGTTSNPQ